MGNTWTSVNNFACCQRFSRSTFSPHDVSRHQNMNSVWINLGNKWWIWPTHIFPPSHASNDESQFLLKFLFGKRIDFMRRQILNYCLAEMKQLPWYHVERLGQWATSKTLSKPGSWKGTELKAEGTLGTRKGRDTDTDSRWDGDTVDTPNLLYISIPKVL